MMKKKTDKKKLIARLDKLFSEIIRAQGVCDHCPSTKNLQCAHVVGRKYHQTRWDLENAVPLCMKCHLFWAHREPFEFVHWFNKKYGDNLYDELKRRADKIEKFDYAAKLLELTNLKKSL